MPFSCVACISFTSPGGRRGMEVHHHHRLAGLRVWADCVRARQTGARRLFNLAVGSLTRSL
jgi:hypothetical protein